MTLREAAEKALEALEAHADFGIKADRAIDALRAALAEPDISETMDKVYREATAIRARGNDEPT